jgi:simple sugar transport system ATP-binding protein
MSPSVPALEIRGISKSFGGLQALDDVSFTLDRGEVVGLLGDNGAGKSTLVKCICGTHRPDSGEILIDGEPVNFHRPEQARAHGIETVFQELALVETLDVTSNLFLGRELAVENVLGQLVGWSNRRKMERETRETLDGLGIRIQSLRTPVGSLSGGQRQSIAVGLAVAWGRHIVLLDEPAAALGVEQAAHVLELIEGLSDHGVAAVLVSHNMQHVLQVCTRVVVLRHGRKVADEPIGNLTGRDLVGFITGAREAVRGG